LTERVVNLYHLRAGWEQDPRYVYVGRAGKGHDGYFGNPFRFVGDYDRTAVMRLFIEYADERISKDPEYRERVKGLYTKTLVCFCAPKQCHADYLAYLSDHLFELDAEERGPDGLGDSGAPPACVRCGHGGGAHGSPLLTGNMACLSCACTGYLAA